MPRKKAAKNVTFSLVNQFIEPENIDKEINSEEQEPKTVSKNIVPNNKNDTNVNTCVDNIVDAETTGTINEDIVDTLTHVVVQLPISAEHIENILSQDDMCNPLEYNPKLSEPKAYMPMNFFSSKNDEVVSNSGNDVSGDIENNNLSTPMCINAHVGIEDPTDESTVSQHTHKHATANTHECKNALCFWCCHPVEHNQFGMPIRYDSVHNNFTFFGTFCSLECVSAYNFSIHMGSDRAWEVQSWIQIMARNYGIMDPIRPAPSRYTLQMFDGNLTIEEFRKVHKTFAKSVMVNIPPLVSIKPQIESLNTSFFSVDNTKETGGGENTKKILKRKAPVTENKKTLESKLNLSYTSLSSIIEAT